MSSSTSLPSTSAMNWFRRSSQTLQSTESRMVLTSAAVTASPSSLASLARRKAATYFISGVCEYRWNNKVQK